MESEFINDNVVENIFSVNQLNHVYNKIVKIFFILATYIKFILTDFNFEMALKSNIKRLLSLINDNLLTILYSQVFIKDNLQENNFCSNVTKDFAEIYNKYIKLKKIKRTHKEQINIFCKNISKNLEILISTIKQFSNNFFKIGFFNPIHTIFIDIFRLIDKYKISLKKIKQIYLNSCLKIYSYLTLKNKYDENSLNNTTYINKIITQVSDIICTKKISSSKMNEILQVSDDDKYRKHYFMFSSDAKQFCLDLINKKKYPLDITMKMCKVPRKSLRRWSHVGCLRKKGCGRKTKNPQMEEKLLIWYNDIMKKNVNITAKMIRDKAVEISDDKDFLASKGWLEKFKKKNGIQIISNKRVKKEVTFHETENNTIINSVSESKNSANKNESVKENEKDEYEINIINENYSGKKNENDGNSLTKNKRMDEFDDKENTNTNIFK
jgi:hypothetical protein